MTALDATAAGPTACIEQALAMAGENQHVD